MREAELQIEAAVVKLLGANDAVAEREFRPGQRLDGHRISVVGFRIRDGEGQVAVGRKSRGAHVKKTDPAIVGRRGDVLEILRSSGTRPREGRTEDNQTKRTEQALPLLQKRYSPRRRGSLPRWLINRFCQRVKGYILLLFQGVLGAKLRSVHGR